eukprot:2511730-Amphidinium_carterae.2
MALGNKKPTAAVSRAPNGSAWSACCVCQHWQETFIRCEVSANRQGTGESQTERARAAKVVMR